VAKVCEETEKCRLLAAAALREFYTLSPGIRRLVCVVLKETQRDKLKLNFYFRPAWHLFWLNIFGTFLLALSLCPLFLCLLTLQIGIVLNFVFN